MIYLDYQATTPLAPEARAAMLPWLGGPGDAGFANPHSPHRPGRAARAAVEHARERIAAAFAPAPGRLIFTSGATEAAHLAIAGLATPGRVVVLATEHACVLDTAGRLAASGREVVVLPVAPDGLVDLDRVADALAPGAALLCAMLVNNEIGVMQPIAALAALAQAAGARLFCDAVQGFGRVAFDPGLCDMVALSAHKLYGPKGIGALWVRDGVPLRPLFGGGGQEAGLRSGTLSPLLCAGFGAAAEQMREQAATDAAHIDGLWQHALAAFPDWALNGSSTARYRGNLSLHREGVDAARLIAECRSLAFSAGSACASGSGRPSHVLAALALSPAAVRGTIRLGFGRYSTAAEIGEAAALIDAAAVEQLRWA